MMLGGLPRGPEGRKGVEGWLILSSSSARLGLRMSELVRRRYTKHLYQNVYFIRIL